MIEHRPATGSLGPRDQEAAPLFLLGAARSGTSLLYKTLCLHPEVSYISNWVRRAPRLPALAVLNRLSRRRPETQLKVWFEADSNAYVYGRRRSRLRRMFPAPVEGEPVFVAGGISEAGGDAGGAQASPKLARTIDAIRRYSGAPVFVSKRIGNNRRIPALAATFPGARFVEIVRDGRAVAFSLSLVDWWDDGLLSWCGTTPRAWAAEGRDPWELCARNWVEELHQIEKGLEQIPSERVMRLSYEELIDDPLRRLVEVAAFAGLPADPAWTDMLRTLGFPDRNERWRADLGPEAVSTIESIQREQLARYGYVA